MITQTTRRSARTAGFTLVEFLVVIAIIGVLFSMLIPVLSGARALARKTQCSNRLKQVGLGFIRYADANNGRFPETSHTGTGVHDNWIYQVGAYLEDLDAIRICPDDPHGPERLRQRRREV